MSYKGLLHLQVDLQKFYVMAVERTGVWGLKICRNIRNRITDPNQTAQPGLPPHSDGLQIRRNTMARQPRIRPRRPLAGPDCRDSGNRDRGSQGKSLLIR